MGRRVDSSLYAPCPMRYASGLAPCALHLVPLFLPSLTPTAGQPLYYGQSALLYLCVMVVRRGKP
jgi:hypothetical protein